VFLSGSVSSHAKKCPQIGSKVWGIKRGQGLKEKGNLLGESLK
jgi:hypothetical protein